MLNVCCRMSALKVTLLLLLVLLSSCYARHIERTDEDDGDQLALNMQIKREFDTTGNLEGSDEDTESEEGEFVRRFLESNGHKRQDDMPGIWGRSIETQDLAQANGDKLNSDHMNIDQSEDEEDDMEVRSIDIRERESVKGPAGLPRRGGPPGLWGREIIKEAPGGTPLWERGIHRRPPGLWGREIKNGHPGPPGLWGREIESGPLSVPTAPELWRRELKNYPPGLWGREIENYPPGLWGREIEKYPPGLWGRELKNYPPGLWGREIENYPPGLWGRELKNYPPGLWGREMPRIDSSVKDEDQDDTFHDDK